ncbi:MAG: hypothetical protein H6700_00060 [Myxococcales bacterium]|nr:hypothetical protein [Myxococcales bacterium]
MRGEDDRGEGEAPSYTCSFCLRPFSFGLVKATATDARICWDCVVLVIQVLTVSQEQEPAAWHAFTTGGDVPASEVRRDWVVATRGATDDEPE